MLGAKLGKNPHQKWQEKPKSSGIYKNSVDLQQSNVKLWWSMSCRSRVRFFFNCSIYIWYNFKALVPLTIKLKDKDKFMLQSLFKTSPKF